MHKSPEKESASKKKKEISVKPAVSPLLKEPEVLWHVKELGSLHISTHLPLEKGEGKTSSTSDISERKMVEGDLHIRKNVVSHQNIPSVKEEGRGRNAVSPLEKLALLEATLFTTTEPLSIEDLQKITRMRKEGIEKLLNVLDQKYSAQESGIKLSSIGGYKLIVKDTFAESVSHLTPHADLSRGLLRVLSIIAYHEPIKQADIVKVVGNRTYEYVKELEEKGLVKTEKKSRTKVLSLTPQFEEYFGVKKKHLKEKIEDIKKEEQEKEQKEE